jgi:signal transduction histidine kinase/ActR/RegA family two-component response regulator
MEVNMPRPRSNDGLAREVSRRDGGEIHGLGAQGAHERAPRWDWRNMVNHEHFVQFYETDLYLVNSVSDFIGSGLTAGDGCIVVATGEHRSGLDVRLLAYGLDVTTAKTTGQYVSLDAEETLAQFMVDGSLDTSRFNEVIQHVIDQNGKGRSRVRVFGEMVALLWAQGNRAGAIRLEELWNELHDSHPFTLFCAYPIKGFGGEMMAKSLNDVCATHSRVIPAESYTAVIDADERMRAVLELQQKAKWLEAEITERKQAEERLRVSLVQEQIARAEAETANRMKDEFLATVSHELRTPLNAIIGWSQVLRSGRIDETTATRAVETIERNAKSQAQLIEDILDVSRAITGKLRLNIGSVDMASVINTAIDSMQLAADSKNIHLAVTLDPKARHTSGDSNRLQQVVWNLLSNAIKFTPSGGRVEVGLERADSDLQITVSDTGQGIRPDLLPFVFDRFRQGDGSSTRRHTGLGLGLAIVRHLVEMHGGTVHAESGGEGLGSMFTIRLPLASDHDQKGTRTRNSASLSSREGLITCAPSLKGLHVLLVDDNQDNLQLLSLTLTECGADVQAAGSAAEAFEVLQWYEPDVLVSDLAMPGEDGFSLIEKVRMLEASTGRRIPAVALTAYVRVEDRARAHSAGFNMFVPKPVESSELITAIANLAEFGATTRYA